MDKHEKRIKRLKCAYLLKRHWLALEEGDEKRAKYFWDKYLEYEQEDDQ